MNRDTLVLFFALIFSLLSAISQVAFAANNPLKDANFDLQLSSDQGGWRLFDESKLSSDFARSGDNSMFNWGFSRAVPTPPFLTGSVSGSYQEFPASPGSRWQLTGYGASLNKLQGAPAFGIVQVSFFDAQGNDLGTVETAVSGGAARAKASNELNNLAPVGEWVLLDTGIATAPAGTATVQAFTLYVDYSGSSVAQGVYFDDLNLCELAGDDSVCN